MIHLPDLVLINIYKQLSFKDRLNLQKALNLTICPEKRRTSLIICQGLTQIFVKLAQIYRSYNQDI